MSEGKAMRVGIGPDENVTLTEIAPHKGVPGSTRLDPVTLSFTIEGSEEYFWLEIDIAEVTKLMKSVQYFSSFGKT
jgi:hypothetical protein